MDISTEEKIVAGLFLCSDSSNEMLAAIRPDWNEQVSRTPQEKVEMIGASCSVDDLFPWKNELDKEIDYDLFAVSHFVQPDLYLRVRPGQEPVTRRKLTDAGISFTSKGDHCLCLSNASKIDTVLALDTEVVVQDFNSQRVGELIQLVGDDNTNNGEPLRVWDCCAASGGKSIMASDILGGIELFVSDVRESILENLEDRFDRARLDNYERFVADLSKPLNIFLPSFNLVIADVPCTGSGTWGRTPEQLFYFDARKIAKYAELQKRIIQTAIAQVEPGGYFLYITCSVFKKENQEQVNFIHERFHLELMAMESLTGYDKKADTLFAALFKKSS